MKVVAIIQARMGSTRYPGKMLTELVPGKPAIAFVLERVRQAKQVQEIWLATTIDPSDDLLAAWAINNNINLHRGSVNDVLDRYYQAAEHAQADHIVRITGDCPFIDPTVIDQVVAAHLAGGYDYTSNAHPPTYPDGLDVEICSRHALNIAWQEAKLSSEREHVTPFLWKQPERFKIYNVAQVPDYSVFRLTFDTPADFKLLTLLAKACEEQGIIGSQYELLSILAKHTDWLAFNQDEVRNAGYLKSLREDAAAT